MFGIIDILIPTTQNIPTPVDQSCLVVDLQFADSNIRETVTFKNFAAFELIMSDVIVHSWKYYNAGGKDSGGNSGCNALPNMIAFFEEVIIS